jgi:pilus assembly protein CpaB
VTFEVTPHSAQAITVAAHLGSLSLALRSFATRDRHASNVEDLTETPAPPVWAGDVSRALRLATPARAGNASTRAPQVIIYRGSSVSAGEGKPSAGSQTGIPSLPPLPSDAPAAGSPATPGA